MSRLAVISIGRSFFCDFDSLQDRFAVTYLVAITYSSHYCAGPFSVSIFPAVSIFFSIAGITIGLTLYRQYLNVGWAMVMLVSHFFVKDESESMITKVAKFEH